MSVYIKRFLIIFFFIFLLNSIYYSLKNFIGYISPYHLDGWLITSTGQGFKKILGGELIFFLSDLFNQNILNTYLGLNLFFYLIFLSIIFYKYYRFADDIKLLAFFFPTSVIFLLFNESLIARSEVVFFAFSSLVYLYLKLSNKKLNYLFFFIIGSICSILIFLHQLVFVFSPLLFLLVIKFKKIDFKYKQIFINFVYFFCTQTLVLIFILYTYPEINNVNLDLYYDKLTYLVFHNNQWVTVGDRLKEFCNLGGSGYICNLKINNNFFFEILENPFYYFTGFLITFTLFSLFLIFYFFLQDFHFDLIDYLIIFYILVFFLICLKVSDWSRYFFIITISMIIFLDESKKKKNNIFIVFLIILGSFILTPNTDFGFKSFGAKINSIKVTINYNLYHIKNITNKRFR